MSHPLIPILSDFSSAIANSKIFLSLDALLVFVCGGKENKVNPCGRDIFLQYASRHLQKYQFIKAETFFSKFENKEQYDILSIEDEIAKYSDCILIIIESESSFAELGAFAIKPSLAQIILPVNNIIYAKEPSFVNFGPIAKINKVSKFKPVVHYHKERFLASINDISQRLQAITREHRKRIQSSTIEEFNSLSPKTKLLYLYEMINILCPLTHKELIMALEHIFGRHNFEILFELSMLESINFVIKLDGFYMTTPRSSGSFIDFDRFNKTFFRAKVINFYQRKLPKRMPLLSHRINK